MGLFKKALDVDDVKMNKKLGDRGKAGFSKQTFMATKLFGSKRKNIRLGKKFRQHGKDTGKKGSIGAKMEKSSSIAPSMSEFDSMMKDVVKKKVSKKS